jgi:hypothetical protein
MSTLAIACALHLGEVGARGAHKHGLRILPNPIGSKPNVSDGRPGCRLTAGFENICPQRLK